MAKTSLGVANRRLAQAMLRAADDDPGVGAIGVVRHGGSILGNGTVTFLRDDGGRVTGVLMMEPTGRPNELRSRTIPRADFVKWAEGQGRARASQLRASRPRSPFKRPRGRL